MSHLVIGSRWSSRSIDDVLLAERLKMLHEWIACDQREQTNIAPYLWRNELVRRPSTPTIRPFACRIPLCIALQLMAHGKGSAHLKTSQHVVIMEDGSVWERLSGKKRPLVLGELLIPART